MMLKKKGGADMLMELALSTIIFFVIVFFLFGINIPKQKLNACAKVVSADAALACETSLMNLMKATSPDGTTYADFLMNSQINKDTTAWEKNVTRIFDKVLEVGDWEMNVSLPNGTDIMPALGGITTEQLGCSYIVPYPMALMKKNCGYSETQVPKTQDVTFSTPDGDTTFTITDDSSYLSVVCKTNCNLDLASKSDFQENLQNKVPNSANADSITLPVLIKGTSYTIDVEELTDANGKVKSGVNATLMHGTTLKDCGLTVTLKTTNITDMIQTCKGKPITKIL
jgi:hypothetical protein